MSSIQLIQIPYHYGFQQEGVGTGLAPDYYVEAGIDKKLAAQGHDVSIYRVQQPQPPVNLEHATKQVSHRLAHKVKEAVENGAFPLVLGGGCGVCLGTLAALPGAIGIVWFDAHGDFNTPETTVSGFFDGMPLAIAAGVGYQSLRRQISARPPIPPRRIVLVGVQQLDPAEADLLRTTETAVVPYQPWGDEMRPSFIAALDALRRETADIYLHFDLDVLTPDDAPAVDFREPTGMTLDDALEAVGLVGQRFRVRAAALTAFNPELEGRQTTLKAALSMIEAIVDAAHP